MTDFSQGLYQKPFEMTPASRDFEGGRSGPAALARPAPAGRGFAPYRGGLKRVFDILVVLLGAPFVGPMVLILAWFVSRDGAPAFYSQKRLGRGGRLYTIWKLRTMVADADDRLEVHLAADPAARAEWERTQKLQDDPRITAIGNFLRKCSLDELPQLWNVLRGEMSLVGPRPMMPCQRDLYPGTACFALRPGITGPWQVSKRNACSFAERATFDEAYARDLSFPTDLRLLLATVRVVLCATGH